MRLIDADELMVEIMDSDLDNLQRDDWKEVIQIVQDAPTIQTQWIPVTERLPEQGKVVLITNDKGHVRYGQYRGLYGRNPKLWTWKGNRIEGVCAWMPLPEPYKEGQNGSD